MLTKKQKIIKRLFDLFFAIIGMFIFVIPVFILVVIASFSTKSFGIFYQDRVGQHAKLFKIYKIKTMLPNKSKNHITTINDKRITKFGKFLRKNKLDELPQIFNVLIGNMSFVGPRPDIQGYADKLKGDDRIILSVKPAITGPATIKFANEDALLAKFKDVLTYNKTVLWPQKVALNKEYIKNWSLIKDIGYLFKTLIRL